MNQGEPRLAKKPVIVVGIAIDDWKLQIFERHLSEAGYAYTVNPGLTRGTLLIKVESDSVEELESVVRTANSAAATVKGTL